MSRPFWWLENWHHWEKTSFPIFVHLRFLTWYMDDPMAYIWHIYGLWWNDVVVDSLYIPLFRGEKINGTGQDPTILGRSFFPNCYELRSPWFFRGLGRKTTHQLCQLCTWDDETISPKRCRSYLWLIVINKRVLPLRNHHWKCQSYAASSISGRRERWDPVVVGFWGFAARHRVISHTK